MAFNEQGFRQEAARQGFGKAEIDQAVSRRKAQDRTGISKWLFGDKTSPLGMAASAAGNVLSLPSYAVGGMMDEFQKKGLQAANPLKNPFGIAGAASGIKNKEAVMTELPESLGIDPNSGLGMGIGFVGELATPGLPIGKIANAGAKALGVGQDLASIPSKFVTGGINKIAGGAEDIGARSSLGALRLSESSLNSLEDVVGEGNAYKFIKENKLFGGKQAAISQADKLIEPLQNQYNAMVRNGQKVSPYDFAFALRKRAQEIVSGDFSPEAQAVADNLLSRAKIFEMNAPRFADGIPIDIVTRTKSSSFSKVPGSALSDPTMMLGNKEAGKVGVKLLDQYAPGSQKIGQDLQALRTFRDVAKKAPSGRGNLPFTPFKGWSSGAGYGAVTGSMIGNPALGAIAGAVGGTLANNPQLLGATSRISSSAAKGLRTAAPAVGRAVPAIAKTGFQVTSRQERPSIQASSQSTTPLRSPLASPSPVPKATAPANPSFSFLEDTKKKKKSTDVYFGY